jgi:dephospho-CoA kinase
VNRTFRVGVTGGIGSGKSAVTQRLEAQGIAVVDADVVAREIVEPGTEALDAIVEHFGEHVLSPDRALDRAALRQIVFANPEERRWLEAVTHPRIGAEIERQLDLADAPYVVLSSPLLLETSQRDFVDHVVVVDVPEHVQLARTMTRDANSEELVRAIMAAQMDRAERLEKADSVLDNSGDITALDTQVAQLHVRLLELADAARL